MQKVFIIGSPGSGKSTLGRKLKDKLNIPLYYLDMIYHFEDKTHMEAREFDNILDMITSGDKWIIDGVYYEYTNKYMNRADTIIYLDIDAIICLKSVKGRAGIKRDDFPYIEDINDERFHNYILNFKKNYHEDILNIQKLYPYIDMIILDSYENIDKFIKGVIF